jgi:hypothetical protein
MQTFIYFFKSNPSDILGTIKADSLGEAIFLASRLKNLGKKEFLEIFEIIQSNAR